MVDQSSSRAAIRAVLETASSPKSIEELIAATGLHANSVRNQLHVLLEAGVVERSPLPGIGRGRRRFGYELVDQRHPYHSLAEALVTQLPATQDSDAIENTAHKWASLLPTRHEVSSADEAMNAVSSALTQLGFEAAVSGVGDEIVLNHCPYAELVESNPVICEIHAALVRQLLEETSCDVTLESVQVFPSVHRCRVLVHRPDLIPMREISATATEIETSKKAAS